jgi:hypothetical protein
MTPMKRPLASAGAVVLLALSLTACGGGAPSDASVKDFCSISAQTADEEFLKAFEKKDYDKIADLFQQQAEEAEKIGTPKGIPDDAREGFEIQVDALKDIDGDTVKKAFESKDPSKFEDELISKDDQKKVEAFTKYENEKCSGSTGSDSGDSTDLPSDLPTDVPTDLPTDIPTDLPSGVPTDLESLLSDLPTNPEDLESLLSDLPTQ